MLLEQAVLVICIVLGIEYYILYLHKQRIEKLEKDVVLSVYPDEDEKDNN